MSSSSSSQSAHGQAEASSSRIPNRQPTVDDDEDSDVEGGLLAEDPLDHSLPEQISFKRKQKTTTTASSFGLPRFFSANTNTPSNRQSPLPRSPQSRLQTLRTSPRANDSTELILNYLDTPGTAGEQLQDTKDANGLDWYVEGPGRRVGYDDLTAIDWIFEYAKERQRLRYLYSGATGILGYIKQLADASQIWLILIAAGILSGAIAAFIDVASDWLGDLKTGYCSNVDGDGRFYLNKGFCCWGYSEYSQCHDWHPWSRALGINSIGGAWIVEYIFFVLFSVSRKCQMYLMMILTYIGPFRCLCKSTGP
jgi:chloride channel 3/4/5